MLFLPFMGRLFTVVVIHWPELCLWFPCSTILINNVCYKTKKHRYTVTWLDIYIIIVIIWGQINRCNQTQIMGVSQFITLILMVHWEKILHVSWCLTCNYAAYCQCTFVPILCLQIKCFQSFTVLITHLPVHPPKLKFVYLTKSNTDW